MIKLPRTLESAVESQLRAVDPRRLRILAGALSDRYRGERLSGERLASTREDVLAYAAQILPATHAQIFAALAMAPRRAAGFAPRSLLDLGAGPGTAAWAAVSIWPSIEQCVMVEREAAFAKLGSELASGAPSAALRGATWIRADLPAGVPAGSFDLVVLAHVLGEMGPADATWTVRRAWDACSGVLAIVEPGTPRGFDAMEPARRLGIELGAHVLAPCPHERACPLAGATRREHPDWCHFVERTERPEFERRAKGASLPWEDAKFSHVLLSRLPSTAVPWARVLRHPRRAKGHLELVLCAQEGLADRTVTRSAGDGWRRAKDLEWGSAVESEGEIGR